MSGGRASAASLTADASLNLEPDEYRLLLGLSALALLVDTLEAGKPYDVALLAGRKALDALLGQDYAVVHAARRLHQ